MAIKKCPAPKHRKAPGKKAHVPAKPARKTKPAPVSKGIVKIKLPTSVKKVEHTADFKVKARAVERGEAKVVQQARSRGGVSDLRLPDLPELGELPGLASLPPMVDPIEEGISELRTFGPDLDESPITDRSEDGISHEDEEAARMADLHAGFRARQKREAERMALATDSEYWVCVVFQDRRQKEQFLTGMDIMDLGDKYIDGVQLAERWEVPVDKSEVVYNIGGADPKLVELVDIDPNAGRESKSDRHRATKRR